MDSFSDMTQVHEPPITDEHADIFVMPTSSGQQRLWFLDHWESDTSTFNIPAAVRLNGRIDTTILSQAFAALIQRHETLRTTFELENGQPVQVIRPPVDLEPETALPIVDLRHLGPAEREAQVETLIQENALAPYDLAAGPLHRWQLIHLKENEYLLLICLHHIISDGWSMDVLFKELTTLYVGEELPPLPLQYADFAVWEQEWRQSPAHDAQLAYWRQQLGGDLPPLDLPTDFTRPPLQTHESERAVGVVLQAITAQLRAMSQQQNGTLFMTLLAAFQLLLHRLTGQDDLVVGTPIASRNMPELEGLIGFFLNSLVLRTQFENVTSFSQLLGQVRETTLAAYQHQEIPFESLLNELQPERDLSRTPLFQVFFNMLTVGNAPFNLPGVTSEFLTPPTIGSKFDMTLYVQELDDGLTLTFDYNAALFTPARMAALLEQYIFLLTQIAANPEQALLDYSLQTEAAQAVLPDPIQPLDNTYHGSVPAGVARWASDTPEKEAVRDTAVSWTYAELESFTNRAAHYLIDQGVKQGDAVAIFGYRNAALVTAVLSALKAGAAFLILDPAYPAHRLVDYVSLAQPTGWLQINAAGAVPDELAACLDELRVNARLTISDDKSPITALESLPETPPRIDISPDDLAYISFTSGSTGKPKGIKGRHGSLTHFYPWMAEKFGLGVADRFCAFSGLAHDPLQRDMFTPLWLGGTVCVPDPAQIGNPGWAANWLAAEGITAANLTPAMGQLITSMAEWSDTAVAQIESLRYAFFVGDVLTQQDVDKLCAICPNLTIVNFYGSTETQRAVSYHVVSDQPKPEKAIAREVIPLGKGMKDVQLLLLNKAQNLAGIGEVAEVYFRSPHLALGYLGDTTQTQARFLPNPFAPDNHQERVYRTGDLGRYLPDGNVAFVSRADNQVKIRGFRVELGEIDAVLTQYTAVQQSITIARKDESNGTNRLAAYITLKPGQTTNETDLRTFLQDRFPAYMVPADIIILDALPLTPNGKVDRRALPVPEHSSQDAANRYLPPRNEVEEKLVSIWEDILGRQPIGVRDNFFELGGHSLQTIAMFAQVKKQFGIDISPVVAFQSPTIEKLAQNITKKEQPLPEIVVPLVPKGSRAPFFFVHDGAGYIIHYKKLADQLNTGQPVYAIQPKGWNAHRVASVPLETMAAAYIEEIRTVQPTGPYYLGGFSFGGLVAYEMARQLVNDGEIVGLLALLEPTPIHAAASNNHSAAQIQENGSQSFGGRFKNKLTRHEHQMTQLSTKELFPYLFGNSVKFVKNRFIDGQGQLLRLYFKTNLPIPDRWRDYYLLSVITRGTRTKYQPQSFNGRVALFSASSKNNLERYLSSWKSIVTGEISTHVFDTNHMGLIQEPHITGVAEILKELVNE